MTRRPTQRGLGRGLSALIGEPEEGGVAPSRTVARLPIAELKPNPDQPRRRFDEGEIDELAASLRTHGIVQPLLVRPDPSGEGWQIVAGERRWRAAQKARIHDAPVVVREDLGDSDVLEIALVENVQRADLDPVEEARAYARLIRDFGHTQERLAEVVGKSRSHLANTLRLLTLPEEVLKLLGDGALTAGHARALVGVEDPGALAMEIVTRGLTVREAEALAKRGKAPPRRRTRKPGKDSDTEALEADLSAAIGMAVRIEHREGTEGAGELRIRYRTLDDLDGLCRLLTG